MLVLAERLGGDMMPEEARQRFLVEATRNATNWFQAQSESAWLLVLVGVVGLTLLGLVLSVIGTVAMFYGFTLSLAGEDLHRAYGLLTRRSSSLPRPWMTIPTS